MRLIAAVFFTIPFLAAAQSPEVPAKMEFAGMTLSIRDDARREIQKDVDALTQSPRHYNMKAERARTYFPLIEKIFAEEDVPVDFKYLALQESALIADAVSVSNAVGFWQFKDFTAIEMGLRIDKEIDERLHIISSTRAAARYLKKNNSFFDNWLLALQSYQMGAGGVMKSVKGNYSGHKHAEITSDTYWYVKKFLAHKVAFEEGVKGKGQIEVVTYSNKNAKTLSSLAKEIAVDEAELSNYNKWVRSGVIPDDREYIVLVPVIGSVSSPSSSTTSAVVVNTPVTDAVLATTVVKTIRGNINGIATIQAQTGENAEKLASRAGVDLADFLKWNDISISTPVRPGMFYFLKKKRVRATEDFHRVQKGEDLWAVSQRYGVRLKKLKKYNHIENQVLTEGTTVWLSSSKPKSSGSDQQPASAVAVNHGETFNWDITPGENTTITVVSEPVTVVQVSTTLQDTLQNQADSVKTLQLTQADTRQDIDTLQQAVMNVPIASKTHHIVQAGETLYGISKMYNVAVMDLVNRNNLNLQEGIKPGQVLKLSDTQMITETVSAPKEVIHQVMASDTLYSIARKYGVTIKELMEWNGKRDFSLAVGEKLKVMQVQ